MKLNGSRKRTAGKKQEASVRVYARQSKLNNKKRKKIDQMQDKSKG